MTVRFGPVRIARPGNCSDPDAPPEIALSAVRIASPENVTEEGCRT
jgi:hypothetical protein